MARTRAQLLEEMAESERREQATYASLTLELLDELEAPLRALYDDMFAATHGLTQITPDVLQAHPRAIKMLRYTSAPTISQMRLGQFAGLGSTAPFEEAGAAPTREQATQLAEWFRAHLDRDRFPWVATDGAPMSAAEEAVAQRYAKLWTVSLIANQNTATKYRNLRKARQEDAVAAAFDRTGLHRQLRLGSTFGSGAPRAPRRGGSQNRRPDGIVALDDVAPGHYVRERKIWYGKRQKADLTARPSGQNRLICVEAKAVGIRIDSTKRLKELNEKGTDWANSSLPITTAGVCAGFFNASELIATIRGRGIPIFWEHALDEMAAFVTQGLYYGAPWDPARLFPDVPDEDVRAVLERIESVSTEGASAEDAEDADLASDATAK